MNDPMTMLKRDHRDVERLLERLGDAEGPERHRLLEVLDRSLQLHMRMEEELLYPLVPQIEDQETEQEAEVEHGLAREAVSKLRALIDAPGFGAAVEMLKGGISHHVQEEESSLLPAMKKGLGKDRWERIGDQMAAMKQANPLPAAPPEPRRATTAKRATKKATSRTTRKATTRTSPAKRATTRPASGSATKKAAAKRTRPATKTTAAKKSASRRSTAARKRTSSR